MSTKTTLVALLLALCACPTTQLLDAGPASGGGACVSAGTIDAGEVDGGWVPLFCGASFAGWSKYLGSPRAGEAPLGLDHDPRDVFSFVELDGELALHVTGEIWGAVVSDADYGSFDLHLEYQWGSHVWPPLNLHDSGLMYLTTGPYGAVNAGGAALASPPGSGAFQVSMEFQIAHGDVGTCYNLGPIVRTSGPRTNVPENPTGWNEIDLSVRPGSSDHFLNGQLVMHTTGFTLALPGTTPVLLTRGRLQLQSEGAEISFRRGRLRQVR